MFVADIKRGGQPSSIFFLGGRGLKSVLFGLGFGFLFWFLSQKIYILV
jgi:hypothetical protein